MSNQKGRRDGNLQQKGRKNCAKGKWMRWMSGERAKLDINPTVSSPGQSLPTLLLLLTTSWFNLTCHWGGLDQTPFSSTNLRGIGKKKPKSNSSKRKKNNMEVINKYNTHYSDWREKKSLIMLPLSFPTLPTYCMTLNHHSVRWTFAKEPKKSSQW